MKKISVRVMEAAAKASRKAAIKSCGAASFCDCYQPAEPKMLKNLKK